MGVADLATQAAAFGAMGALFLGSTRVANDTARSMLERGSSGTEAFWGSMAVGTVNMLNGSTPSRTTLKESWIRGCGRGGMG
ncbi:exported hypothetical protein [uncultured Eubacteriales bacterium]|uniref:Uncharacterized protein n=1 Tax=uncultured Eubacteriales bacterium TaxID=172733 RepID=A0A212JJA9_9FIRM|nr:exported hypothetical protein [uncultured Eubacteriales bacterium]